MGTLYLVATPIGNLEDITLRALQVLRQAALVAAEDTRQTQKLLSRYEIKVPTISYHEHNKLSRVGEILSVLTGGDVALVSDAGTPGLNDPGYELVRAALEAGYPVSPVPGPTAPVAALVASGLPTDAFLYLGYLPRRGSERRKRLLEVAGLPYTLIFLETPHRLIEALEDLQTVLGDRPMAVARELTKIHEEIFRGTIREASEHFAIQAPRGEFTLVIGGPGLLKGGPSGVEGGPGASWNEERLTAAIRAGLTEGKPKSLLAGELAAQSGRPRREVYRMILAWKDKAEQDFSDGPGIEG
jgi:16S rRNA (cytidine1402-2'-O)-methyltransferase